MGDSGGVELALTWEVLRNDLPGGRCQLEIAVENLGRTALRGAAWAIYFNGVNPPEPGSTSAGARAEHVNGDLYRIVPTREFSELPPGATWRIQYVGNAWALQCTDAIRGAYVVWHEGTPREHAVALGDPRSLPLTRPEQLIRGPDDLPAHDSARDYRDNQAIFELPEPELGRITPTPAVFTRGGDGFAIEPSTVVVHAAALANEARHLCDALQALMGLRLELSTQPAPRCITLELDEGLADPAHPADGETYRLEVLQTGIVIRGANARGVFYGVQSLLQLATPGAWRTPKPSLTIDGCTLQDAPRFAYRGLLLDVARNFAPPDTVRRVLDVMALYKLNKLHLHLTDDEGWRLEIPTLPELTEVGARRGHSPAKRDHLPPSFGSGVTAEAPGSGFYSRADFIELLRYAAARHIHVIPELDVPGHARAAVKAMEARYDRQRASGNLAEAERYLLTDFDDRSTYRSAQGWCDNVVCVGLESSYAFIEVVVCELKRMFAEAGAVLDAIHVGGDEMPEGCWQRSPRCQQLSARHGLSGTRGLHDYFYQRLREIFQRQRVTLAGWEEIALLPAAEHDVNVTPNPKFVAAGFLAYVWNTVTSEGSALRREDLATRLTDAGYEIVLCSVSHLYLDFAYVKHPDEPGYYWGGYIDARKVFELEVGDERVRGIQGQLWGENLRTAGDLEFLLLPRLVALAERAWSRVRVEWLEFANRLGQRELPRLDGFRGGFAYRVPVPGAILERGLLHANLGTPGLALRYTTDGSDPTLASAMYQGPIATARAKLATFTSNGRRSRIVTVG